MAKLAVLDKTGKKVSDIELKDEIFAIEPNKSAMHLVVVNYLANQRQGTQSTLTRSEVSGGGKKPWKQKGTGRARQGSTRAPQWTHGGIALGPKPRAWKVSINKKVKRLAMKSALSSKVVDNEMVVIENLAMDSYKTKTIVNLLKAVGAEKKALIVTAENDKIVAKSAANIPGVKTAATGVNTYDVVNADKLILSLDAAKKLEEVYA